mmetsp:Transcript_25723/g.59745  ORF Transcript_25723/g.59745 Transcript_25723/m.59745 type:complete len:80 (+) Transcript_25723:111-350(+)
MHHYSIMPTLLVRVGGESLRCPVPASEPCKMQREIVQQQNYFFSRGADKRRSLAPGKKLQANDTAQKLPLTEVETKNGK